MKHLLNEIAAKMQNHYGYECMYLTNGKDYVTLELGTLIGCMGNYYDILNITAEWDRFYIVHNHDPDTVRWVSIAYDVPLYWDRFSKGDIRNHNYWVTRSHKYQGIFIINSVSGQCKFLHRSRTTSPWPQQNDIAWELVTGWWK
jgi:hypothetical protein